MKASSAMGIKPVAEDFCLCGPRLNYDDIGATIINDM